MINNCLIFFDVLRISHCRTSEFEINRKGLFEVKQMILVVFGTRPEAIKMCPVVKALRNHSGLKVKVCVTGQHREMLHQVLDIFEIVPEYDLDIMSDNQTLFDITAKVLERIRDIYVKEKPDAVLVHGDTTTAFAAALAAFYMQIPVGHVEAGLRTYNMSAPYPEEFNRQAIDVVSKWYFAPTEEAKKNLIKEGKKKEYIYVTGNTVIDALKSTVVENYTHPEIEWSSDSRMLLITAHRRENIGESMHSMFSAIRRILDEYADVKAIYPVHLNPSVRKVADEVLGNHPRIHLIEPLDVLNFHNFMNKAYLVLTDSGGIQEEAPSLGKPVLVMRNTTERPEGVAAGTLKLVGTSEQTIYSECKKLLDSQDEYSKMSNASNPYGDGYASERIVKILSDYFM